MPTPEKLAWDSAIFRSRLPNQRAENGPAPAHTRIGWLRSVANIYHAYGVHSFVGELANAAGKDPVEYVLALLGPDRIMPK